jgi:acetolactate synthase-1/2/3 large subunit
VTSINAGRYIIRALAENGVTRVFSVPGESTLPVFDALRDSAIDLVTCHHESAAGLMALADARLTGGVGVCIVSRGPGATNASIALHCADEDAAPLLLLVGQVPKAQIRRGAGQEIDYSRMFAGIAKWVAEVTDPERLPDVLARAFQLAVSGKPGPVVVAIAEDMLNGSLDAPPPRPLERPVAEPGAAAVAEVAGRLRQAARPLLIAGGKLATPRGRRALLAAARAWNLPVAVSWRRHDLFPNDDRLYAGHSSVMTAPAMAAAHQGSDFILAVGTRLTDYTTRHYTMPASPWPTQTLVHVYDDPDVLGWNYRPDRAVVADPVLFLEQLTRAASDAAAARRHDDWIDHLHAVDAALAQWQPATAGDGVVFGNFVAGLTSRIERDAIVTLDAGMCAAMFYRYFRVQPPQELVASLAAIMGWSVPAGVAAAMRYPGRQVISVAGDGGFLMTGNELALAAERHLRLMVVVANNRSLGSIRRKQEEDFPGRPSGTALSTPDFAAYAKAFGCAAYSVACESELWDVFGRAAAEPGPVLVEIKTSLAAMLPEPITPEMAHAGSAQGSGRT